MKIRNVFLAALMVACMATGEVHAEWRVYETRNFIVYSDKNAKEIKKFSHSLEEYRAFLVHALNVKIDMLDQLPLTVFLLDEQSKYNDLVGVKRTAGIFSNTPSGPVAAFFTGHKWSVFSQDSLQVMRHEYVHHLMRQQSTPVYYPLWYSEGMAEFLSTYYVKNGQAVLGDLLLARMPALARQQFWFDMKELLTTKTAIMEGRPKAQAGVFYGQAWLLTRMLFTDAEFQTNLNFFVTDLSKGISPEEALKNRYSLSFEDLDKKFRSHYKNVSKALKGNRKIIQISLPAPKASIEVFRKGKLSAVDSEWVEQQLTYKFQHSDKEHKNQAENGKNAYEKTGDTRFKRLEILTKRDLNKWDEAWEVLQAVLSENPKDPHINLAAGQLLIDREFKEINKEENPRKIDLESVKLARQHLTIAVEANEWDALSRLYMANSYIIGQQDKWKEATPYILDAYALYPQYFAITRNYLDLLLHEKNYGKACLLLRPLFHLDSSEEYREDMQKRLDRLPNQAEVCPV